MGSNKEYLIVRPAKLYDVSGDDKVLSGLINDLNSGRQLTMAIDQIFSPTYVREACKAIELLIDKKITGCYNVCSSEAISRYEFAKMVKEELGIKKGNIAPCSIKELEFGDNRPLNISMSNKKFTELTDFKFMTFREMLGKIKKRTHERSCNKQVNPIRGL
ncbi:MAG: sugar nucleotide-binding protein [Nanoarchaeota archaeon]